jgi:hypothetical protein
VVSLCVYAGLLIIVLGDDWNGNMILDRANDREANIRRRRGRFDTSFQFCLIFLILMRVSSPHPIRPFLRHELGDHPVRNEPDD